MAYALQQGGESGHFQSKHSGDGHKAQPLLASSSAFDAFKVVVRIVSCYSAA